MKNFKHLSTQQKVHDSTVDMDAESINQHLLTIAQEIVGELQLSTHHFTGPDFFLTSSLVSMILPDVRFGTVSLDWVTYKNNKDPNVEH